MKKTRLLLTTFLILPIIFCLKTNAQNFGAKTSSPTVYLIGGGAHLHFDKLNWGELHPENGDIDYTAGPGLHFKGEIRKYFGTSGWYFCPNLRMTVGMTTRNNRTIPSISNKLLGYYCVKSDIIPALGIAYDFDNMGIYFGAGYMGEYLLKTAFFDTNADSYPIMVGNRFMGRPVLLAGIKGDWYNYCIDMDILVSLGNQNKSFDGSVYGNHFQLNSPIMMLMVSGMKKYKKTNY